MSQENLEIMRNMCGAFFAGNVPAAMESFDPEVEWRGTIGGVEEMSVLRGRDGIDFRNSNGLLYMISVVTASANNSVIRTLISSSFSPT